MTPSPHVIATNLREVRERIAAACDRVGREPSSVTLIGVTKGQSPEHIAVAVNAGLGHAGENRLQEALPKIAAVRELLAGSDPDWHFIGHLQTNKARAAAEAFAILHSVDSERLLRTVAAGAEQRTRVFLQVNVSGEITKSGCTPDEAAELVSLARSLHHVSVDGLMTIAPRSRTPEDARPVFRSLADLGRELDLPLLSMGMTDDFEVAIEEGATHVRIGRAIFGERGA